jgi:hypothetical protein
MEHSMTWISFSLDLAKISITTPKIISLAGMGIELWGFWVLAKEVIDTNKNSYRHIVRFLNARNDGEFTKLLVSDGPGGVGRMQGGLVGALSDSVSDWYHEIVDSRITVRRGIGLTAAGILGQAIGTFLG